MPLVWVRHSASRACRAAACGLHYTLYNIYNKHEPETDSSDAFGVGRDCAEVCTSCMKAKETRILQQLPDNKASFFCSFFKNKLSTPRGAHKTITSLICGASRSPLLPILGRGKPNETHSRTFPCLICGAELEQKC